MNRTARATGLTLICGAAMVSGVAVGASGSSRQPVVAAVRHHPEFTVMGMLGLAGDRFLLWHGDGRMQVGTAAGEWTKVFRLAVHALVDVQPDGSDFLVTGALDEKTSAVLRVGPQGHELTRWTIPGEIYGLVVDARGRWASTRVGLVPLLAGAALGKAERLPEVGASPYGAPPVLVTRQAAGTVVCRGKDISLAHHAPGQCLRTGDDPWQLEGDFMMPPLACGGWLLAIEGARPWRLAGYSLTTGNRGLQIPNSVRPAVACLRSGDLLIGDRRLSLLRLPGRKPLWTAKVAGAAITDLAVSGNWLAYRASDSADVVIIAAPAPQPATP